MSNTPDENLADISKKLDIIVALLLEKSELDPKIDAKRKGTAIKVNYLADFGLSAQDISRILNAPIQSVRTLLTPTRRKKSGRAK